MAIGDHVLVLCGSAELGKRRDLRNLWRFMGSPVPGRPRKAWRPGRPHESHYPSCGFPQSLDFLLDFPEAALWLLLLVRILR